MYLRQVEHRPADAISKPLVVQNKRANRLRQLCALPLTLDPTSALLLTFRGSRTRGLDGVGRGAKLVCGDMRHRSGLTGSKGGAPGSSDQLSCRSLGMAGRCAGLRHRDFAARPGLRQFDGSTRPIVIGLDFLEQVQHMLCASGCPFRKQVMIRVLEGAAAPQSDEPGVSLLW